VTAGAALGPDPATLHPLPPHPRVVFLQPLAAGRPNVTVGRYSYYDDPDAPELFFERNVLHHYEFSGDHLHIGPFCAFATGVRIFMNGANHAMSGFSTYPFDIFGHGWDSGFDPAIYAAENRGDTLIGPDVWIGHEALILPGTRIGAGAVIAARAVVSGEVPPYAIVGGNPARVLRRRYEPEIVDRLLAIAWWDWPPAKLARHLAAIRGADIAALEAASAAP
jgi:virginiamycin A acetyltransferase